LGDPADMHDRQLLRQCVVEYRNLPAASCKHPFLDVWWAVDQRQITAASTIRTPHPLDLYLTERVTHTVDSFKKIIRDNGEAAGAEP
jgi:hypothetical protein